MFLLFFCISAGGAVLFFCVQVYTAIFLKTSMKLPPELVDQLSICTTLALFPLTILAGFLSDKIGRKPVVVSGLCLGALFTLPAFYLLMALERNTLMTQAIASTSSYWTAASLLISSSCSGGWTTNSNAGRTVPC